MNKYGVEVSGPGGVVSRPKVSGPELLCQLKEKVEVSTLTSDLQPFSSLTWASQLPPKPLTSELGPFKTCAVVSSAGSLRYSGLGKEIGGNQRNTNLDIHLLNKKHISKQPTKKSKKKVKKYC